MVELARQSPFDDVDAGLLTALQDDGRATWSSLAERVGLSAPSTAERVRRLEAEGVISSFRALLDPEALGLGTLAFVAVSMAESAEHEAFVRRVRELDAVQECHVVAGDYDYMLKVRCRSPRDLAELLRDHIRTIRGVARTGSVMVLDSLKETPALPTELR